MAWCRLNFHPNHTLSLRKQPTIKHQKLHQCTTPTSGPFGGGAAPQRLDRCSISFFLCSRVPLQQLKLFPNPVEAWEWLPGQRIALRIRWVIRYVTFRALSRQCWRWKSFVFGSCPSSLMGWTKLLQTKGGCSLQKWSVFIKQLRQESCRIEALHTSLLRVEIKQLHGLRFIANEYDKAWQHSAIHHCELCACDSLS